jgi:hypothetical protein
MKCNDVYLLMFRYDAVSTEGVYAVVSDAKSRTPPSCVCNDLGGSGSSSQVLARRCGSEDRQVSGCCECGNEPSGSIKCGEFLDYFQNLLDSQYGFGCMELLSYSDGMSKPTHYRDNIPSFPTAIPIMSNTNTHVFMILLHCAFHIFTLTP